MNDDDDDVDDTNIMVLTRVRTTTQRTGNRDRLASRHTAYNPQRKLERERRNARIPCMREHSHTSIHISPNTRLVTEDVLTLGTRSRIQQ